MNQIKDLPNQNFIEIFPNKKNIGELSKDEALSRYKKNAYILGRIFSNYSEEEEDEEEFIEETKQKEISHILTEEKLEYLKKELDDIEIKHQIRLENYKKKNKRYHELLNEVKHIKNEKKFEEIKKKLIDDNFYGNDHPFFCEESSFYLNTEEDFLLHLSPEFMQNQSSDNRFENTENLSYYDL